MFINYGRLSSAVSTINYGFLEDDPSLPYSESPDVDEEVYGSGGDAESGVRAVDSQYERLVLRLNLFGPRNASMSRLQQNMIAWRLGKLSEFSLRGRDGSPTPGTRFMLRMLALGEGDADATSFNIGMAARIDGRQRPLSVKNECGAAAILLDVCKAAQDAFTTSLKEDLVRMAEVAREVRQLSSGVSGDGGRGGGGDGGGKKALKKRAATAVRARRRERAALKLRIREKDILADCVVWARSEQRVCQKV